MMSPQYSLAFCPPSEIVEQMRQYKKLLQRHIGWFHSANSLAHATVATFRANNFQLTAVSQFASDFCARRAPLPVLFDHFGAYASGAFFVAPDERSRNILNQIMKDFNQKMPLDGIGCTDPHMSIARGLDLPELLYVQALFTNISPNFSFLIDGLSLRRLNETRGQYDIVAHFPFGRGGLQPLDYTWQERLF